MKKRNLMILASAVLLVFIGMLRFWGKDAKADNGGDASLRTVAGTLVKRGQVTNSLTLSGAFRPYEQVDVHAKVAGFIRKIYVDVGDHVRAGQVLAILEVPELSAQVAGAKADIRRYQDAVRRSQSEIQRAESNHSAVHSGYTRLKQASESRPGLIAEQELDDSQAKDKETGAQIESARASLAESESRLGVARAELERLSALASYSNITAPFAGVVTKRYADTGALIQAGTSSETQSMPVVQLAEWSRLRLVVPVPESAVSTLQLGSRMQVHVSAINRDFEGRVARFADALNDETRTMHTEIDVGNADGSLKEGMYAEARMILNQENNVLMVPIQAIQRNDSGATVLTVDPRGRVEERQIEIGAESNDGVEVRKGLAEKEQVILGNRSEFRSGEIVSPKIVSDKTLSAEGTV